VPEPEFDPPVPPEPPLPPELEELAPSVALPPDPEAPRVSLLVLALTNPAGSVPVAQAPRAGRRRRWWRGRGDLVCMDYSGGVHLVGHGRVSLRAAAINFASVQLYTNYRCIKNQ
jgi:hypothetical protein